MKKLVPALLVASLVANAAFVAIRFRSSPESAAASGGASAISGPGGAAEGSRAVVRPAGPASGEGAAIARALNAGDAETLRDELRAAGVEEELVKTIVTSRLWKRYEARMKAMQAGAGQKTEWWKQDEGGWWGGQTKEQREELKALQTEIKAEGERLFGTDPTQDAQSPWLERQYGYLPPAKRLALQQLEQDYNEMQQEAQQEARGFSTPADAEKARFIAEEKRRDLQAVLTPEEFAAYELRHSRTAGALRWQMTRMDATEQEFIAIYNIRKIFDDAFNEYDQFGGRVRTLTPDERKLRGEAEKAMKAEISQTLGPERYAAYVRSQDNDYQQLQAATRRFSLPADTAERVYALRQEFPAAALKIADDPNLSAEQKKAEATRLANEARARARQILGTEIAEAYFANNGMQWAGQLERGSIVTYDEHGGQTHRRIDQAPRKPTP